MGKHAYMIIAHNNFYILEKLLKLIDDERNDVFIHIDKKVVDVDLQYIKSITKKSKTTLIEPRLNIFWGSSTQVDVELALLKNAVKGNYDYYHLISGVDLPLKSQDYIHKFFEENKGTEFIGFTNHDDVAPRVKYYRIFTNTSFYRNKLISYVDRVNAKVQSILGVNRLKHNNYTLRRGAQWFSITNDLAKHILSKKEEIVKFCDKTICSDEVFMQTFTLNSKFKDKLHSITSENNGSFRCIDWKRGNPYVFRSKDFQELVQSPYLFARKFDVNVDKEIVDKIYNYIKSNK
ncbi:beta-1,6-N-acetylglucosaminyltransferase [Clostridium tarantellae]|uniref:Peptide O-xylosyltransferase n=1 Tax=Clostridium tarantellae TaxID=39493 RepID=A0A6I1MM63_9CLOT|nr:beta-1,6-N-acetylglucosaminyltransferase [Clostridium tarantellae]MPQ43538.1 glycosyl transferase [Clostridium tarantellae]